MLSDKAKALLVAREPTNAYGTDPIDLENSASDDFVFVGWDMFEPTPNAPAQQRELTRPALSRNPHVNVPINTSVAIRAPFVGAENAGTSGAEAPVGTSHLFCAAGFSEIIVDATSCTYAISSQVQPSLAGYVWKRDLRPASAQFRLYPVFGVRLSEFSFGANAGEEIKIEAQGESSNLPNNPTNTAANKFGWSESLAWFTASDIALDQHGASMTHTGSVSHDMSPPMFNVGPTITINSVGTYTLSGWRIRVRNTLDIRRGGASGVVDEVLIGDRELTLEATLKGNEAAFDLMMESIRENYEGAIGEVVLPVSIAFTDGRGSGGTTCTITGYIQFDMPAYAPENRLAANTIAAFFTHDWVSGSFLGDGELSIAFTETA